MKILISHLIKSLQHPTWTIILEARLVRFLMNIGQNEVPTWIHILANAHGFSDHRELVKYIKRYELRDPEAGRASPMVGLMFLVFVIGISMLLALAGQTGAALSMTVAQMDVPAVEIISYDGLAGDIQSSMAEITQASKDYSESHGLRNHGAAAEMVRNCMAQRGPSQTWQDADGHRIQVCQLPNGQIGFQVERYHNGSWRSVTEYIKSYFRSLADAAKYMRNGGAVLK